MTLRYTNSADGKPRVNLRVALRFDAEEIEQIKELAKEAGEDWRTWLRRRAEDGVYRSILQAQDAKGE